jgi:hypothetical protein
MMDRDSVARRNTATRQEGTLSGIITRAIAVWIVLIVAETVHGLTRGVFLVPRVGEFRSNQIGVFTGSIIILVIAFCFVRWIGPT